MSRLAYLRVVFVALAFDGPARTADTVVARNPRVLVIVADDCPECDARLAQLQQPGGAFATLRANGWRIGPAADNHVQLVPARDIAPQISEWQLTKFPAIVCVDGDEIVRSFSTGCATPLDAYAFGFLLKGVDERPQPPPPEEATVVTTGHYPLRGQHWSVDGNFEPTQEQVAEHLRGPNHNELFPQEWEIETWSLEELLALHDDLHEQYQPLPLLTGREESMYVPRPPYTPPAATGTGGPAYPSRGVSRGIASSRAASTNGSRASSRSGR
jgi:hypothetical protein